MSEIISVGLEQKGGYMQNSPQAMQKVSYFWIIIFKKNDGSDQSIKDLKR